MIPACDLSTCPAQSHVHFLWGQRRVPSSRWLHSSRAVPRPCYTDLPQKLVSWRLQPQRGYWSGGWVGPSLTLPWPLHHNMSTFPLFNVHFPHDMRISMILLNLEFSLLLPPTVFITVCDPLCSFTFYDISVLLGIVHSRKITFYYCVLYVISFYDNVSISLLILL